MVAKLSKCGLPPQYLLSACRFYTENKISVKILIQQFKQWMNYVVRNENVDVNKLTYIQFWEKISECQRKYGIPNKIYDDGKVSIGKLNSHKDMNRFPIKNNWCIKQPNMFQKYVMNGYQLFIIDNGEDNDFVRYAIMLINRNGMIYYWDITNTYLDKYGMQEFNSTLTIGAKTFIKQLALNVKQKSYERPNNIIAEAINKFLKWKICK